MVKCKPRDSYQEFALPESDGYRGVDWHMSTLDMPRSDSRYVLMRKE